jgi:hypothetical protein
MWPFKSKIPRILSVHEVNDDITLVHSKGIFNFNKNEILKFHYQSDFFSETPNHFDLNSSTLEILKLFGLNDPRYIRLNLLNLLIILGGSLNMNNIFFRMFSPYSFPLITFISYLILSFIFCLVVFILLRVIIKYLRLKYLKNHYQKDIVCIWTKSQYIKIRFSTENNPLNYLQDEIKLNSSSNITDFKGNSFQSIFFLLVLASYFVFYFNREIPFWFYQIIEQKGSYYNSDLINQSSLNYWSYFSNVNPIRAFYDGMISSFLTITGIPAILMLIIIPPLQVFILPVILSSLTIFYLYQKKVKIENKTIQSENLFPILNVLIFPFLLINNIITLKNIENPFFRKLCTFIINVICSVLILLLYVKLFRLINSYVLPYLTSLILPIKENSSFHNLPALVQLDRFFSYYLFFILPALIIVIFIPKNILKNLLITKIK